MHGTFNISKGRAVQLNIDNPDAVGIMILKSAESDALLRSRTDLADILGAAGNEEADFTNYARIDGLTATLTVGDRTYLVLDSQTIVSAGNGTNNTTAKVIVYIEVAAADATRIPIAHYDFVYTTTGVDLPINFPSSGFWFNV